jgi:hypothetical protein
VAVADAEPKPPTPPRDDAALMASARKSICTRPADRKKHDLRELKNCSSTILFIENMIYAQAIGDLSDERHIQVK